ncbi:MAG: BLUF domain-containing protein [Pseudomonadota bacterium]
MKALAYFSQARGTLDMQIAWDIARVSAARNHGCGVTGYLSAQDGLFFQYLEGDSATVDALLIHIREDARHRVLCTREEHGLEHRRFPDWSMQVVASGEAPDTRLEHLMQVSFDTVRHTPHNVAVLSSALKLTLAQLGDSASLLEPAAVIESARGPVTHPTP